MRTAIISDIHGNLEALEAVLRDIADQGCQRIVCLGDIIGYGPNPCECLDVVMGMDGCVLGNHDYGALIDPEGFSAAAEQAIFWTRKQLEGGPNSDDARRRLEFLARLPRTIVEDRMLLCMDLPATRSMNMSFPKTSTIGEKWKNCFPWSPSTLFKATRTRPVSSP